MEWSMRDPRRPTPLIERLHAEQCARWQAGEPVLVESYVRAYPNLLFDTEQLIDLIYNEFCLREERYGTGQAPDFLRRFPHLSEDLEALFAMHGLLNGRPSLPSSTHGNSQ
jgi:hypothetical protein